MGWPKGKPRGKRRHKVTKASTVPATCKACGEEKTLADFPYAYWRKGWKYKKSADPTKYRDSCKDCTRAKNGVELDPDFPADRGNMPGRPRKDKRARKPRTKTEIRAQRAKHKRKIRRKARIACLRYLAKKGCEECGERDPRVLEFDHLDPKKKGHDIAVMMSQGYSWANERLRREIRKCRVLCANCHRRHTIEQQGYYSHDDVRAELDRIFEQHGIDR